jgi:serine phosphatase RsbU (regulator of sigma subunit)
MSMTQKSKARSKNIWFLKSVRERRGFAVAVFFIFAPIGALSSLMAVADPPWPFWYVAIQTLIAGIFAASIILTMHRILLLLSCVILFTASILGLGIWRGQWTEVEARRLPASTTSEQKAISEAIKRYRETAQPSAQRDGVIAILMIAVGYTFVVRLVGREWEHRAARDAELQVAKRIQTSLAPSGEKNISGFDIYGLTQPANEVAGDYFDYLELGDGKFGVLIADAAGHGVAAGLLAAMMKGALQLLIHDGAAPEKVMHELNRLVSRLAPRNMFVTGCYAVLDKSRAEISYVTAGHEPMLLLSSTPSRLQQLRTPSAGLGMQKETSFEHRQIEFSPGDTLLLYTDGLVETENRAGEPFGIEKLESLLAAYRDLQPRDLGAQCLAAVASHRGAEPQQDDMTLIIIRRTDGLEKK